jgi:hypothetical protein
MRTGVALIAALSKEAGTKRFVWLAIADGLATSSDLRGVDRPILYPLLRGRQCPRPPVGFPAVFVHAFAGLQEAFRPKVRRSLIT